MYRRSVISILVICALLTLTRCRNQKKRQIHPNVYLPRCKFDEGLIKNDARLYEKIQDSRFCFTGKVTNDIVVTNKTVRFSVVVRRFFKQPDGFRKDTVTVSRYLHKDEGVKCRQIIRPKFTAIFIGDKPENSENVDIELNIVPLPVTLTNLDRVSYASKGTADDNFIKIRLRESHF